MTLTKKTGCSIAAILMTTTAVFADVTPEQVWEDLQQGMAIYGQDFQAGTSARDGDTLTVSGAGFTITDETNEIIATFPDIALKDMGDGTVSVMMTDDYKITLKDSAPYADFEELILSIKDENLNILVSGDPENMMYDVSADSMTIAVDKILPENPDEPLEYDINAVMNGMAGKYSVKPGDIREITQDLNINNVTLTVDIQDPNSDEGLKLIGNMDDIAFSGENATPSDIDTSDPAALFGPNVRMVGNYTFGETSYDMNFVEPSEGFSGKLFSAGGKLDFSIENSVVSYIGASDAVVFDFQSNQLPVPIKLNMAGYDYAFEMPMAKSEEPKDVQLGLSLREFTMNDEVWGMFDPTSVLPRDPATIAFNIAGQANWLVDILGPEGSDAMMGNEPPMALHQMNLNSLLVEAAGAKLTGDGKFTFDNTDLETFDGLPRPAGQANMTLVGINGLIDNLISMGLLPEDQAMGARMMMGMFAVPGEGDDTLTSTIEVNDEGHVLANGQRLR